MRMIILAGQKIKISIILVLLLVIISCLIVIHHHENKEWLAVSNNYDVITDLEKENDTLRGILEHIVPKQPKVLYENPYRLESDTIPNFYTYDLHHILEKGNDVPFHILYHNQDYQRPMYASTWKDFYYRSWLYLPSKISDAYHTLFLYQGGLSAIYDFEGGLGFQEHILVDYHKNLNCLVYNFHVANVKKLGHQIILVGRPARKGAAIVSIKVNDVLSQAKESQDYLFQLSTPKGYELDFLYNHYHRSDTLNQEESTIQTFCMITKDESNYLDLKKENHLLKTEISYYFPLDEEGVITQQSCRNSTSINLSTQVDIATVIEKGREINYGIAYESLPYRRPIYDPTWEQKAPNGWAYIPEKVCQANRKLFVLPSKEKERLNILEKLSFYEPLQPIKENESSLLIYNFMPSQVFILNHQMVLLGIPHRTGALILTINKNNLMHDTDYLVQLITPDFSELDYDVLKINSPIK